MKDAIDDAYVKSIEIVDQRPESEKRLSDI